MSSTPEQRDLPNDDEKRENMEKAARELISRGGLTPTPWAQEAIQRFIENPPVLHHVDDPEPCRGRQCLTCDGCDSFRTFIQELREMNQKDPEDMEDQPASDVPPLNAASEAHEQELKDTKALHDSVKQNGINFSKWEVIKFAKRSIEEVLKIDIFLMRKRISDFTETLDPKKRVDLPKDTWNVIRVFLIVNGIEWWLDSLKAVPTKGDDKQFTLLETSKPQEHYYLPGKMLYVQVTGTDEKLQGGVNQIKLNLIDLLAKLPTDVSNRFKAVNAHFAEQVKSQALWKFHFDK